MTHTTTTRRAATSAARELLAQELQERAELVAALWDARREVEDALWATISVRSMSCCQASSQAFGHGSVALTRAGWWRLG